MKKTAKTTPVSKAPAPAAAKHFKNPAPTTPKAKAAPTTPKATPTTKTTPSTPKAPVKTAAPPASSVLKMATTSKTSSSGSGPYMNEQPKLGKAGALLRTSDREDDPNDFIRGMPPIDEKAGADDGKFVIPKILLQASMTKGSPEAAGGSKICNTYEMIGGDFMDGKSVREDRSRTLPPGQSTSRAPTGADRRRPPETAGSVRGGGASLKVSKDSKDKKKERRRFIRDLLKNDQYGEVVCCPRMIILLVIWTLLGILVGLLQYYVLGAKDRLMVDFDNETDVIFWKVLVKIDGAIDPSPIGDNTSSSMMF